MLVFIDSSTSPLVLDLIDKRSHMGEQLDGKLVAGFDEFLRVLGCAYTGRGTGQDDRAGGQGRALGEEADQLGDAEDQVAVEIQS